MTQSDDYTSQIQGGKGMYFIDKENELVGKEIIFTHFARFSDQMIIVTKDKGVFVFDKDEEGIDVYREHQARRCLFDSDYVRKELNELGIITDEEIEQYKKELQEKWNRDQKLREERIAKQEYEQYLRLKKKYEEVQ